MPCRSDYNEPNEMEIENSKVTAILEEFRTGKLPKYFNNGYKSEGVTKQKLDENTAELCGKFRVAKKEFILSLSLEAQMWWRDHQKADAKRTRLEREEDKIAREKRNALRKLSPRERKLLKL